MDAGRMDFTNDGGTIIDTRGDGVKLAYGDKVKVYGWALKGSNDLSKKDGTFYHAMTSGDRVYVAGVIGQLGIVNAAVNYYKADMLEDTKLYEVAADVKLAKDLRLKGAYYHGDLTDRDLDKDGYLVGLTYAGAKAAKVGSWGLYANYSERPASTYLVPTVFKAYAAAPYATDVYDADGYKGFEVGANYTLAKNIVAGIKYFDLEAREGNEDARTLWSEIIFTF